MRPRSSRCGCSHTFRYPSAGRVFADMWWGRGDATGVPFGRDCGRSALREGAFRSSFVPRRTPPGEV